MKDCKSLTPRNVVECYKAGLGLKDDMYRCSVHDDGQCICVQRADFILWALEPSKLPPCVFTVALPKDIFRQADDPAFAAAKVALTAMRRLMKQKGPFVHTDIVVESLGGRKWRYADDE